jgi:hypothetical protein
MGGRPMDTTQSPDLDARNLLELYEALGLTPIPLKCRSKKPLVKWGASDWPPPITGLRAWVSRSGINWGVRCGSELAVLDFDEPDAYRHFLKEYPQAASWPRVKTGRGHHLWVKPTKPIRSLRTNGIEIKGVGSYVVAPPSVHPSGNVYYFEIAPNGTLPEVDLQQLLSLIEDHRIDISISNKPSTSRVDDWVSTNEQQETFRWLFSIVGVYPGQNPTWCPWHPDREGLPGRQPNPSLSVDWGKCLFNCHSPRCGEHGGIEKLSDLVVGETDCQNYPLPVTVTKGNSDIPIPEAPPWNQWELEEPPEKHCGLTVHLRHKHRRKLQRIIGALCGRCDCGTCGPYLKEKWKRHLTPHIIEEESVYLATVSKAQWATVYRRIRRADSEYAKIELNDGYLAVFTTASEGIRLPLSLRVGVLQAAIDAATFAHRAISTSRGWGLPKKQHGDSEWELISTLPGTVDDAKEVVRQLGLEPRELSPEYAYKTGVIGGFDVELPDSWLEDDERGFKIFSEWLDYGPIRARDAPPVVATPG